MKRTSKAKEIQWLIDFTEIRNLDALPPKAWLKVKEKMLDFLGWKPWGVQYVPLLNPRGWAPWLAEKITPQSLAALQKIAKVRLGAVARGHRWAKRMLPDFEEYPDSYKAVEQGGSDELLVSAWKDGKTGELTGLNFGVLLERAHVFFDLRKPGECRPRLVSDDPEEAFRFALGVALSFSDTSVLRICPTCSRLFWASHKKQKHCDLACKNKRNLKKHRDKERLERDNLKILEASTKKAEAKKDGRVQPRKQLPSNRSGNHPTVRSEKTK